jgi:hypothetical protein
MNLYEIFHRSSCNLESLPAAYFQTFAASSAMSDFPDLPAWYYPIRYNSFSHFNLLSTGNEVPTAALPAPSHVIRIF